MAEFHPRFMVLEMNPKRTSDINSEIIEKYLQKSENDLYVELIPEHLREEMYDERGLVIRGKQIFRSTIERVKSTICPEYRARQDTISNSADLVALLIDSLTAVAGNIPVLTIATLIAKTGIGEICADRDKP